MRNELERLALRLQRAIAQRPTEGTHWREPAAMPAALARVRQSFGERLRERSGSRTNRCLLAFRLHPEKTGYVELKLICRAVARPADWEQRRLLDDERLFRALLAKVEALQAQPRRYLACLRALEAACQELRDEGTLQGNALHLQDWLKTAANPSRETNHEH